jgi:metal-sulfur cluster biosynthetic enzyme
MQDPEQLKSALLSRLVSVIDPETGIDVVRMRLIENLTVDAKGHVRYTFRPSSPLCPLAVPLAIDIRRAVREVPGVMGQTTRVEGYVRAEELTTLLEEDEREHEKAGDNGASTALGGLLRRIWHSQ